MRTINALCLSLFLLMTFCLAALAQEAEDFSRWSHFHEVPLPEGEHGEFNLTPSVFGTARADRYKNRSGRADMNDLRLVDAAGKVVPYALRIRTPRTQSTEVSGRVFDVGKVDDKSWQLSIDLGDQPVEYTRIALDVTGTIYSRPLRVEGSNDGKTWATVLEDREVVKLSAKGQRIDVTQFDLSPVRYRYLKVNLGADKIRNEEVRLSSATLSRQATIPGEEVTLPATLGKREAVRHNGQPASAWDIDLGAANVPVQQISLRIKERDFARPFHLTGDGEQWVSLETQRDDKGDGRMLMRTAGSGEDLVVKFQELATRKLRLIVTDSRNPPLTIEEVKFTAPARQIVFPVNADIKGPLRLYSGNPEAGSPNYDFAATLATKLPPVTRVELGKLQENPQYVPPPKPWTERWPFMTDVVLALACVVLLALLLTLARGAMRRADAPVAQNG